MAPGEPIPLAVERKPTFRLDPLTRAVLLAPIVIGCSAAALLRADASDALDVPDTPYPPDAPEGSGDPGTGGKGTGGDARLCGRRCT